MSISVIAVLVLLASIIGLVWSANLFVSGSASTAKHIGMTPTMIGLTIVAFGTSAPEMITSASAALAGVPSMGIGNAIGSNIANIGLVLGATALITKIPINAGLMRLEIPLLLTATFLAAAALWDYQLSNQEGWSLLACTVLTSIILILHSRRSKKQTINNGEETAEIPSLSRWKSILLLIVGLIALLASVDALIWSATTLAEHMGVSPLIIGLTVVALGTSLPELAASVASALKGHHEIAIGNIIGSNILNIMAVMALPGIIAPTTLTQSVLSRDLLTMVLLTLALVIAMWLKTNRSTIDQPPSLGRAIGMSFIAAYIAYYAVIILLNG